VTVMAAGSTSEVDGSELSVAGTLEFDFDRTPTGRPVSHVDQIATLDIPDVAAPDQSCGFERVLGSDWRNRYPAIAGGVDEARRQHASPTAPADDPRRSGPPPGVQGSAFESLNSEDRASTRSSAESLSRRLHTRRRGLFSG
jgi:hypothetical protein